METLIIIIGTLFIASTLISLGVIIGIVLTDRKWMDNADFEDSGILIRGQWYKVTRYVDDHNSHERIEHNQHRLPN